MLAELAAANAAFAVIKQAVSNGKEIAAAENKDEKKAELLQNYRDKFANPFVAAEKGFLDDVIKPSETRDLILKSLNMLENKTDQNIPKKHGNIPL